MTRCEHCGDEFHSNTRCPRCRSRLGKSCLDCHRELIHGYGDPHHTVGTAVGFVVEFRQPGFRVWTEFSHENPGTPPGSLFGYDADEADRFWKALNREE